MKPLHWEVLTAGTVYPVRRLCCLAAAMAAGEVLETQLAYWKQQLGGAPLC